MTTVDGEKLTALMKEVGAKSVSLSNIGDGDYLCEVEWKDDYGVAAVGHSPMAAFRECLVSVNRKARPNHPSLSAKLAKLILSL